MPDNYFTVFNLPSTFDLDLPALEKAYFEAQRKFHPDRLVGKSQPERTAAIRQSMLVNEAYEALKTPLLRARHLLALHGIKTGDDKESVKPSMELLTEMMERREALAEADKPALKAMEENARRDIAQVTAQLAAECARKAWPQAAELTLRLAYLEKLAEEIRVKKKGLAA